MSGGSDRVALTWGALIAAVTLLGGVIGFVLLPAPRDDGLWAAVCSALGIRSPAIALTQSVPVAGSERAPSLVAWTPATIAGIRGGDAGRGKVLVETCAGCHGADGIGTAENFPNLAGQSADATYKQLADFRSGKRENPLMSPFAKGLSDAQIADISAYYAAQPAALARTGPEIPPLVAVGDPLRSIAPCGACHGAYGLKAGAPLLAGQKAGYLDAQLRAFATDARTNDINAQMRGIAKNMRSEEIAEVSRWYESASSKR